MSTKERLEYILDKVKRYSRLQKAVISLACVVVFATTYMLILPALTLEHDTVCGMEAHAHSKACYSTSTVLICDQAEVSGHSHSEDCYEISTKLACDLYEDENHTHTADCYTEEKQLVCDQMEAEGHSHDASCYAEETELFCTLEEHEHKDDCYAEAEETKKQDKKNSDNETEVAAETESEKKVQTGDPNADLESSSDWEKTLKDVVLTGDWSKDILTVAYSQLGYQESTKNYVVDEDGKKRGYTRYGAWYGDPYGHWCAMYVSFCIYYADIDTAYIPLDAGCQHWIETLSNSKYNLYHEKSNYVPKAGDLIFFNWDKEPDSDHVGIVTDVTVDKKGNLTTVYTIEGNSSNQCKENIYSADDGSIMGYAELPENPELLKEKKNGENSGEEETADEEETTAKKKSAKAKANSGVSLLAAGDNNGAAYDFTYNINAIYVSVNNQYITPTGGSYQISQNDTVKFEIEYTLPGHTLDNTNTITYHVPTNGLQAQSGYVTGTINGVAKQAGTYTVAQDGTVTIIFNDEFVTQNQAGNQIDGTISLYETASNIVGSDSDSGNIRFRDDLNYNFRITDRTHVNYDLNLAKTQSSVTDGKVTYTIKVSTSKGTNNKQVSLSDTLNSMQISGNVSIQNRYGSTIATISDKNGQSSFNYSLPAMSAGDEYTITYQAEAAAYETNEYVYGTNTAKAEFTDDDGNKYEPTQTVYTTFNRSVISKDGYQNGSKIDWTITVNNSHQNIAGWVLTDEMMQGVDITVSGGSASDYTYDKTNGKLTFADNGSNTNTYTVSFSTPVTASLYGTNVTNTARIKDKNNTSHEAYKQVYVSQPAEVQPLYKTGEKQSDGSIRWTILINNINQKVDLTNQVLSDEALKNATDILVERDWNSYADTSNDVVLDQTNGTVTFRSIDSDGTNTHIYKVYYTTHPDYHLGQNTFTNVGQLSGYSPVTSSVDGGNIQPGSKSGTGYTIENDTIIANWHTSVGGDFEMEAPWTFQDWLDEDSGYYTMAQLKEIEASLRQKGISNFTMVAFTESNQSNSVDGVAVNAYASSDSQFKKFMITFQDSLSTGTVLSLDYHSTGAGKDQTKTYNNHAKLNDTYQYDASVSYESIPVLKKTNLWGDTLTFTENDPNQNYINWLLEINIPEGTTDTQWTITEHVPDGLNPVYIDGVQGWGSYPTDDSFSITSSKNGDGDYIITFNPSLYAGQTKYIKVAGLVRESEIPMNADKSTAYRIYQNSASITFADGSSYEAAPVDKRVEREYEDNTLAKDATFDEATGIISYHIDIDPSKVVDEEDKTYSLVDEITYNHGYCALEILPASIVVKESLTGRTLTASECLIIQGDRVDDGGGNYKQKIYFTIVSDQPICIEYQYQYTNVTSQLWGHGVTNRVTLENGRGWKSEISHQMNNNYKESDATAIVNSYPVYKVDAADHTTFLPGAAFTIYKWDNGSQSYVQDATAVTEADGSLRNPNGFKRNVAYKIVETAAPTGYQVNSTPVEFYTKDKNTVKYPMSLPENFSGTVLSAEGVIYFENTRVEGNRDTQISVKKNWVDYLGNDISNNVNTDIQFVLKRIEKKYSAGSSAASGSDALPGVIVKFQYSDGYFQTMFLQNASIGDTITAKLNASWSIYDQNGNLDQYYTPPSVNGEQCSAASGYNAADTNAFYIPITVNSRAITIDIPYDRYNGNNVIGFDAYVSSSGGNSGGSSGGSGSSLLDTIVTTVGTYTITRSGDYEWNSQDLPAYRVNSDNTVSTYSYYIEEIGVQGYLTSYSRNDSTNGVSAGTITITNTQPNENEDTEISLQKVWRYSDNTLMIDEDKPEHAVIEVWQVANGDKANAVQLTDKTVTLNASNGWRTTILNLPKVRKNGNNVTSYTYYFVEQAQTGYEVTYSNGDLALSQGTVIVTNKQVDTPQNTDTSVTVSKVWKDSSGNTIDAPADQSIILDLYQIMDDGEPVRLEDQSVTLPDNGNWSKTIEYLPLTRIDEENSAVEHQYKYYFVEREVPAGYEVSYTKSSTKPMTGGTETITNKKVAGITVNKEWLDANGNDITASIGDASVPFELIRVASTSAPGNAARAVSRAVRRAAGTSQTYNVNIRIGDYNPNSSQYGLEGYACSGGTITIRINSWVEPQINITDYDFGTATGSWMTGTTMEYTSVSDNGDGTKSYVYNITVDSSMTILGLSRNNTEGCVTVNLPSGGGSSEGESQTETESESATESETEPATEPDPGTDPVTNESVYAAFTLPDNGSWSKSFTNLETTGTVDGRTVYYTYYVREREVSNYTTSYTNNNGITDGVITVTNTSTRTPEYTEVILEKKWKGSDDQELSPEALQGKSARFKLMTYSGNNKSEASQYGETFTLPENGNWTKTFSGLPKKTYDASGNAIHWKYYFEEVAPGEGTEVNYQKESIFSFLPWVDGSEEASEEAISGGTVTVTNKMLTETADILAEAIWQDASGNEMDDSELEEDIVVYLDLYMITDNQGPGEKVNENPIELNEANNWSYGPENLVVKEYVNGEEHTYAYYFVEAEEEGYTTTYQSGTGEAVEDAADAPISEGTFRIINKRRAETSVSVNKRWFKNVNGNVSEITGTRDGYVEFYLYRVKNNGSDEPETPHEHTWNDGVVTTEPGEYTEGVKTYTCTGCGETKTEPIAALGHTSHHWDNGSITTLATCNSKGVKTYTCSGCSETYTEDVPIDPDNHTGGTYIFGAVDATETTDGYTGDTKCSGCNAIFEAGTTIPATGGGTTNPPAEGSYSVTILDQQWGTVNEIETVSVPAGQSLVVTFETTGQLGQMNCGWFRLNDYAYNATSLTCEQLSSRTDEVETWKTWNKMQVVYTPEEDSNLYLNSGSDINVSWSLSGTSTQSSNRARSLARARSAPAKSASSKSGPTIPSNAEIMNNGQAYRVYANEDPDENWADIFTFAAEPGAAYSYYVVEINNENFTTEYEGQGTNSITIKNTITEETYSLPMTGGRGTRIITMLAMIMIFMSGAGLMIKNYTERRKDW